MAGGMGERDTSSAVEIVDLRKRYGALTAVDGLSLTAAAGEILGILGPNGAGKTTTAECLTGLRTPDEGRVRIFGRDPLADGDQLHEVVGVQLQSAGLQGKLRVREIMDLYASFYRYPADAGELLRVFGLAAKRDSFYKSLSGGQKQRLSIALALIGQPKLAVLDEMTTGLDPRARRATWDFIESVRERGTTIVIVTHFMDEAQRLCDRVALIDHGRIVATGTPRQLAEKAGGGKRMRFIPDKPFDDRLLTGLPEVMAVAHQGAHVLVSGSGRLVNAVILALDRVGVSADDVELQAATLEDAFIELTGSRLHEDDEPEMTRGAGNRISTERTVVNQPVLPTRLPPRDAFRQLLRTETLLTFRQPTGLILGLVLPVLLLVIFGSIPAFGKPMRELGGLTLFDVYLPILVSFVFAGIGLTSLPVPLASYRETGVLRRLSTTPLPPSWVLAAQLIINVCIASVAVITLVSVGVLAFGLSMPRNPGGFILSCALSAGALLALGLWDAAIARTGRAAGAIGAGLFYPLLFFAGLWVPQPLMPALLRDISAYTPLGAAVEALQKSVQGPFPPAAQLLTMAAYTGIFAYAALRAFRWQ